MANPIFSNVIAFRTGNKRMGIFLFCAITTMCFIRRGGSTLASNKMQHTLLFSRALVIALIPKTTHFLCNAYIEINLIELNFKENLIKNIYSIFSSGLISFSSASFLNNIRFSFGVCLSIDPEILNVGRFIKGNSL